LGLSRHGASGASRQALGNVFRGEGLELVDIGPFFVLVRGDARKWPIQKNTTFGRTEVQDAFDVAGLDISRLDEYKARYCGPDMPSRHG